MLAAQTPGFTGADLANLINEAALLTARQGNREISMNELEEGIMRVIAGPEKKTRVMSEKERLITAYHEMGHELLGEQDALTSRGHTRRIARRLRGKVLVSLRAFLIRFFISLLFTDSPIPLC